MANAHPLTVNDTTLATNFGYRLIARTKAEAEADTNQPFNGDIDATTLFPFLTDDKRYLFFSSDAENLVSGDQNNEVTLSPTAAKGMDIFRVDLQTGAVLLVDTSAAGIQADHNALILGISGDGRYVRFSSPAGNLIPNDTVDHTPSGEGALPDFQYVKDLQTGAVTRITGANAGLSPIATSRVQTDFTQYSNAAAYLTTATVTNLATQTTSRILTDQDAAQIRSLTADPDGHPVLYLFHATADARFVYVTTADTIFRKDMTTGDLLAANHIGNASYLGMSPDGSTVYFNVLTSGGAPELYAEVMATGDVRLVSAAADGTPAHWFAENALLQEPYFQGSSADGRYVLFSSNADNLVAGDTNHIDGNRNTGSDEFVKDLQTGAITRVSVDAKGHELPTRIGGDGQPYGITVGAEITSDGKTVLLDASVINLLTGAQATGSDSPTNLYIRNLLAPSSVTIDTIAGDDELTGAEKTGAKSGGLPITGTTFKVEAGSVVTVSLPGHQYTGTVASDGTWAVIVPGDQVGLLRQGAQTITASVSGTTGTATASRTLQVDTPPEGGGGDDTLDLRGTAIGTGDPFGYARASTFAGYGGNDTFAVDIPNSFGAHYDGGDGIDTLVMDWSLASRDITLINGGTEYRSYTGHSITVTSNGLTQTTDYYYTLDFTGVERFDLTGGLGADTLKGGAADDVINPGKAAGDALDGGDGTDTLVADFSNAQTYANSALIQDSGPSGRFHDDYNYTLVTFANFEIFKITASPWGSSLFGANLDDVLIGNAGNDTLNTMRGSRTGSTEVVDGKGGVDLWRADLGTASDGSTITTPIVLGLAATHAGNGVALSTGTTVRNIEKLDLVTGTGDDAISTAGYDYQQLISTGAGSDAVDLGRVTQGADVVDGGDGLDTLTVDFSAFGTYANSRFSQTNGPTGRFRDEYNYTDLTYTSFERFDITAPQYGATLYGGGYDDRLTGGAGDDTLVGNGGRDTLLGGGGNDTLDIGIGVIGSVVDGGAGTGDRMIGDFSASSDPFRFVSAENTLLTPDTALVLPNLVRVSGIELLTLTTGSGNDLISTRGTVGQQFITTGGGDDRVDLGAVTAGSIVDGGTGTDTLTADFSTFGTYAQSRLLQDDGGTGRFHDDYNYTALTFTSFERFDVTASQYGADLFGGNLDDRLTGGAGDDNLYSKRGAATGSTEVIDGKGGTDFWKADLGTGSDGSTIATPIVLDLAATHLGNGVTLSTGTVVRNIERVDLVTGTGDDVISTGGGALQQTLSTGLGNDFVDLGALTGGNQTVDMGPGTDTLKIDFSQYATYAQSRLVQDATSTGRFHDDYNYTAVTFTSVERFDITGTQFGNDLYGGELDDRLVGGAGNDTLNTKHGSASGSTEVVDGLGGVDLWRADLTVGSDGTAINAPIVLDLAATHTGGVVLATGTTVRNIERLDIGTGGGDDSITTAGYDYAQTIRTGAGNDTVNLGSVTQTGDVVDGGDGQDTLVVDFSGLQTYAQSRFIQQAETTGASRFHDDYGYTDLTYTSFERVDITGTQYGNDLSGGALDDRLKGGAGADNLYGGGGNDLLIGGAGADRLDGGAGIDTVSYADSPGNVLVDLTNGTASHGDAAGDTLISIENLIGSAGDDILVGNGYDNVLSGHGGADYLAGRGGQDTFAFDAQAFASARSGAAVHVTDYDRSSGAYDAGEGDRIDLSALSGLGLGAGSVFAVESNGSAYLQVALPGGGRTTLAVLDGVADGQGVDVVLAAGAAPLRLLATSPGVPSGLADAAVAGGTVNAAGNTAAQALTGTAEAGSTVTVFDGTTVLGTTAAGATGAWSYALGPLAEGSHSLSASATGASGLPSARSAALAFTVDTVAPSLALSGVSGAANRSTGHVVSGTVGAADAGLTVTLRDGTTVLGTATADAAGRFSVALADTGSGATRTLALTASATDAAGNAGTSAPLAFTFDYTDNRGSFGIVAHDARSPVGEVYALYEGLFGRAPDEGGLRGWAGLLGAGTSLDTVAGALLGSDEGRSHFNATDNTAFVRQLYTGVLGRTGDPDGVRGWADALNSGGSRAAVADAFVFSDEHVAQLQPALTAGIYLPDPNAADVARLYHAVLGRDPDAGGLAGLTAAVAGGASLSAVAGAMLGSGEYGGRFASLSDTDYASLLYQVVLGRPGESDGIRNWVDVLGQGASRVDVAKAFVDSDEFQMRYAGQSDETYVRGVYEHVLGRIGDAGGIGGWTDALSHGATRLDVANAFANSDEFKTRTVTPSDAAFVETLYEHALGRPADAGGLHGWLGALSQGASRADIAVAVGESGEARLHLAGQVEQGWHLA